MFDNLDKDKKATEPDKSYFSSPPSVSLPKGGGAIKGMGEKFAANPVTGTGSMSVPIATSPSRSGFGPQLSLSYDSGSGNNIFGLGWNLSIPSITRKTDKGLPRYFDAEESDIFILSGAEDLVPILVQNSHGNWERETLPQRTINDINYRIQRYRPRIEGLFARIERWTNLTSGETHWRSISKDNITTIYGKTAESQIVDPNDSTHIFSWLICESYDDKGNAIRYEYKPENSNGINTATAHEYNRNDNIRSANRYLKRIQYGNKTPRKPNEDLSLRTDWMFEIIFDYGEHDLENPTPNDVGIWSVRNDPFSSYRAGFEVRTYRLCQRVLMFHHFPEEEGVGQNCLVRSTNFTYSDEINPTNPKNPIYSKLISVSQIGYKRNSESGYIYKSLPPLEFTYSEPEINETVREIDPKSLENLPQGLDGSNYQWVDLDGEGLSGILTEQGNSWFYKRNLSPLYTVQEDGQNTITAKFAPMELIASQPSITLANGAQFLDLAGDGQLDVVTFNSFTPGFYERTATEEWEPFIPFKSLPVLDWNNPNLKFIDLNGDGHADILITEDNCFVWHPSLAENGFGTAERVDQPWDEEKGPRVVFADSTQSIYLADFSGDGLTDIVRIRNGEVCYWPNLGYGRFGAKITMDNSPWFDAPDIFNQRRIILADIDGSGTTDILYLSAEGVQVYFNQSGNSWSKKRVLRNFPAINNLISVTAIDLLGNGTACLVWSSPLPNHSRRVMRYIDLMGGEKPHLLIKTVNNLGAETTIQYAPSTKFYLQDKFAGKPWVTKLPFPVHVVEKVTVFDKWRQTHFTSTYSYHHGYFDGVEREFRGFGRVEQTDVEDFGTFTTGNIASPYISDDKTLYQPPVKTITWFHTGAFLDRERILSQFANEYFPYWFEGVNPNNKTNILGDFQENILPEPNLISENLSAEEWREALRACKGMMLRQEIYELDVDALEQGEERKVKLFSTAFHNCQIQCLQPRSINHYAVFLVTESEVITYHYELNLQSETLEPDPRISHTLNLRIDEYGNVLESVAVAYPRIRQKKDEILPEDAIKLINQVQQERHLVYSKNHFTNDVTTDDQYRLRLPCEVKTYELTGIIPSSGFYYTLKELQQKNIANTILEIPYHVFPNHTIPQKRLVEQVRMLYFSDNLETPLIWGELNALGLPYETYKLALTTELLNAIFKPEQLIPEIQNNLDNANLSGYLSGETLAQRFPDFETNGQYWIRSGIAGFASDATDHFYLPERYIDPFEQTTILVYDSRDLYIKSSTDPIGNITEITQFDFRVLAASQIRDINGNLSQVYFDVLGLPTAMAVMGKGEEADNLSSFNNTLANPTSAELNAFFVDNTYNENQAKIWLENSTARYIYYFGEQQNGEGKIIWGEYPACACSIMREQHRNENTPLQVAFEYSDGMGNVLVKKIQAEPETPDGLLRWIATGKTILNNKGKPVKQYEPYFSPSGHHFEEPIEVGVTPILYYDAVGRQIRTEMPDGTYNRVEFSPWFMAAWDANDTILEAGNIWYERYINGTPEGQRAARLAAIHANTPAVTHLDSLGREVVAIANNKWQRDGVDFDEKYVTFTKLDIEGKPLWIRDARENRVMEYINPPGAETDFVPCYDIAGNLLFQHSMDGGDRWMLMDATGQPFYAWDRNERVADGGTLVLENRIFHTTYDALRRPLEQQLQINDADDPLVVERFVYRDPAPDAPDLADRDPEAAALNLGGQVYQHYDPSGLMTNQRFDFKGNLLEATRQLTQIYDEPVIDWNTEPPLEERFTQRTEYDALNRMTRLENWHRGDRADRPPAVYIPQYNQRGVLVSETLSVRGRVTEAILHIEYDAKGQRTRIHYGNGTTTRYHYDPETFRLVQLRTTRTSPGERLPTLPSNLSNPNVLQNLYYTYDPVGNITEIHDDAYEPVFFNNQMVEPRNTYTYDALYRLIEATGRENYQATAAPDRREDPPFSVSFPVTDRVLRNYTQTYTYDPVGNILLMSHVADRGSWTRDFAYAENSNRLLQTWKGDDTVNAVVYDYDTHGSMLNLANTLDEYRLRWDYRDMIHTVNLGGGGQAFYNYDAGKQRSRKRIERNNGGNTVEERLYLGGMELYGRWVNDSLVEEIETHHLFVDDQRVLIVEDVLSTNNPNLTAGVLFRYQYSNHLGSVGLELNGDAAVISYEEYHPYGTTAYRADNRDIKAKAKRYRYTGMERDEETGLSYHTARYYLPWLGRWGSCDPIGLNGDINSYYYCKGNPINYSDTSGKQSVPIHATRFDETGYPVETGIIYEDVFVPFSSSQSSSDEPSVDALTSTRARYPELTREEALAILEIELIEAGLAGNDAEFDELIDSLASEEQSDLDLESVGLAGVQGVLEGAAFALGGIALGIALPAALPFIAAAGVVALSLTFLYMTVQAASGDRQGATETLAHAVGSILGGSAVGYASTRLGVGGDGYSGRGIGRGSGVRASSSDAIVVLDENGLPTQIHRPELQVEPAYSTIEDAAVAAGRGGHYLEVLVFDEQGNLIATWFEASQRGVGSAEVGLQAGHTEQIALLRMRLRPGVHVEMRGFNPPCQFGGGCYNALQDVANATDATFSYRRYDPVTGRESIYQIQSE
ncbi:SpvB/TcaC N-terminal domain-containing protein [Floridanema evergladense]|uniref:SpvB/TcaC N-terminal domain-containing protein n=1 Tax=Floridaenema evergladense BLCC-F167 TaxID=3153639 RepID=A0ABV4WE13_9CYAN